MNKLPITAPEHQKIVSITTDREFRILLEILWETGARPLEVARLTADHVDLTGRRLRVYPLKWEKGPGYRPGIPLNQRLADIFRDLPNSGPFFPRLVQLRMPVMARYFSLLRIKAGVWDFVNIHSYRLRQMVKAQGEQ